MAMMGGGFFLMFLFPLLMLGLLALVFIVAAGGMGWMRGVSAQSPTVQSAYPAPLFSSKTCPACRRPAQADWQMCPYDGTKLD